MFSAALALKDSWMSMKKDEKLPSGNAGNHIHN